MGTESDTKLDQKTKSHTHIYVQILNLQIRQREIKMPNHISKDPVWVTNSTVVMSGVTRVKVRKILAQAACGHKNKTLKITFSFPMLTVVTHEFEGNRCLATPLYFGNLETPSNPALRAIWYSHAAQCALILITYRQWRRLPRKHDNWRHLNMAGRNLLSVFRGIASDRQLFLHYFSYRFMLWCRKKMWFWGQSTFHVLKFSAAANEPPKWEKSLHRDQTVLTVSDKLHRATAGFADKTTRCYDFFSNKQPDALLIQTLFQNSTCFGQPLCPSSGFLYCTFGTGKFRAGFWWPYPSRVRMELLASSAERTIENSWWWAKRLSETCRVLE